MKKTVLFLTSILFVIIYPIIINAESEPEVYINNMEIYISGKIETGNKQPVSIMVVDKDSNGEKEDNIQYINQVLADNEGKYNIHFNAKQLEYDIYINDGKNIKKQYEGIDYSEKIFVDCDLSVKEIDKELYLLKAELFNIFRENTTVYLYTAAYGSDNRLICVNKSDINITENESTKDEYINVNIPNNAEYVKAFAWIDMNPMSTDVTVYEEEKIPEDLIVNKYKDNFYKENEEIFFQITGSENEEVLYTITDFWGNIIYSGSIGSNLKDYSWKAPKMEMGYYIITFKYSDRNYPKTHNEYLAVLTDYDFVSVDDSPFGINAHLMGQNWGWKPELVDYMAFMGAKSIRDGQEWESVEKEKGVFTILDEEIGFDLVRKYNMNMNLCTGYGNEIYDGQEWYPWSTEGREAYTNYQLAMIEEFEDIVTEVDVWNEWYGGGDPLVSVYGDLLRACYPVTKEKYPNVKILGNAIYTTEGEDKDWYKQLLQFWPVRVFTLMDGIFPHMYPDNDPENCIPKQAEGLKKLNAEYGKEDLELYMTELGAMTGNGGLTEEVQASMLVRSYCLALANGYKKIYWYDFMDDGNDLNNVQYNFGLIHHEQSPKGSYSPKPAYVSYGVMTRMLTGYEYKSISMVGENSDIYCVSFEKAGDIVNVIWSLNEQILELNEERSFTDIMGGEHTASKLDINMYPIYLKGNIVL